MVNSGTYRAEEAEVWGVIHCLRYAWERGTHRLELETDSRQVLPWLSQKDEVRDHIKNLIAESTDILNQDWQVG